MVSYMMEECKLQLFRNKYFRNIFGQVECNWAMDVVLSEEHNMLILSVYKVTEVVSEWSCSVVG